MLVKVNQPVFSQVELAGRDLIVHFANGEKRRLLDGAGHFAAAVSGKVLHIVGFLEGDFAWHYYGEKELRQERIDLGGVYGGGAKLITDSFGGVHLLYFTKQATGYTSLLRHCIFQEEWFGPLLVTANIPADAAGFSAAWHRDQYLHAVYCGYRQGRLFYRVFDLERRIWSGAAPLTETQASQPQLVPAQDLHLFWQEQEKYTVLKVRVKGDTWGIPQRLGTGKAHVSQVGFAKNKEWRVFFSQGDKFYETTFGSWAQPTQQERGLYDYTWAVIETKDSGGLTMPIFQLKEKAPAKKETPPKQAPAPAADEKRRPKEEAEPAAAQKEQAVWEKEAKLQTALIEEAFRTLKEWEDFKKSMLRWQAGFQPPKPVELAPLTSKLSGLEAKLGRLERSLVLLKQGQGEKNTALEKEQARLEEALGRLSRRLGDLELLENRRQKSLWRRVLARL